MGALLEDILLLPKLKTENADMLKSMHDSVYEAKFSIKNMEISTDNWDPLLSHILTRKLATNTLIHYECQLKDVREVQSLQSLLKYLESRFMALQSANKTISIIKMITRMISPLINPVTAIVIIITNS